MRAVLELVRTLRGFGRTVAVHNGAGARVHICTAACKFLYEPPVRQTLAYVFRT